MRRQTDTYSLCINCSIYNLVVDNPFETNCCCTLADLKQTQGSQVIFKAKHHGICSMAIE